MAGGDQVARALLPIDGALGLGHGGTSRRGSRRHGGFLGDAEGGNAGVGLIDLSLAASEIRRRQQEGGPPFPLDLAAGACRCHISNAGSFQPHLAVFSNLLPDAEGNTAVRVFGGAIAGDLLGSCGGCCLAGGDQVARALLPIDGALAGAALGSCGGCCLAVCTDPNK